MKALTLWPEWSWAICHLGKRIENRTWFPPGWLIGKTLAIHAGANIGGRSGRVAMLEGIDSLRIMAHRAGWASEVSSGLVVFTNDIGDRREFSPADIPKKAIVASCVVGLGGHATPEELKWAAEGQCHWLLTNVGFPEEPIPVKGAQGLWTWDGRRNAR